MKFKLPLPTQSDIHFMRDQTKGKYTRVYKVLFVSAHSMVCVWVCRSHWFGYYCVRQIDKNGKYIFIGLVWWFFVMPILWPIMDSFPNKILQLLSIPRSLYLSLLSWPFFRLSFFRVIEFGGGNLFFSRVRGATSELQTDLMNNKYFRNIFNRPQQPKKESRIT